MDYSVLNMLLSGAGVLLVREAIAWYANRRKENREDAKQSADDRMKEKKVDADVSIPINEQAVRVYKDIIDSLRTDMNKLVENMNFQDDMLLKCREEKVELKAELKVEKEIAARELATLRSHIVSLEARVVAQEKKP